VYSSRSPYHKGSPYTILQFAQSPWLRDYIELNTKFRTLAKNDFEKNVYKLLNNTVWQNHGERTRSRRRKVINRKADGAMIAKQNFYNRSVFSENLVAVELRKLEVKFDKPIYMGMCIHHVYPGHIQDVYEFHHEYMALFREKCKMMYTNTDTSLIYHIECEDVYDIIKRDISRFDTNDYSSD